jgi:hypothetical protein
MKSIIDFINEAKCCDNKAFFNFLDKTYGKFGSFSEIKNGKFIVTVASKDKEDVEAFEESVPAEVRKLMKKTNKKEGFRDTQYTLNVSDLFNKLKWSCVEICDFFTEFSDEEYDEYELSDICN